MTPDYISKLTPKEIAKQVSVLVSVCNSGLEEAEELIAAAIRKAVEEEREACASVCFALYENGPNRNEPSLDRFQAWSSGVLDASDAIRQRGAK
jgi:hypothetical protein